jgi:hypothetical protein
MTVARPVGYAQPAFPPPWDAPGPTAAAVPAGLRRRQYAARRLPPLLDGRRDPIEPRSRPLLAAEVGRRTVWYLGLDRPQAVALFRRAAVTRFMEDSHGWCTSIEDGGDVLTVAQHALGYRVTVEAVDR